MEELRYEYCPPRPGSGIDHVGTYKRHLPVSLERMYENTLDWEHLPYLHASSFSEIECLEAGSWGWRCKVKDLREQQSLLELRLDRSCRRWITRNIEGPSKGAEIWTHVFVTDKHAMDIVIDFFIPGAEAAQREKIGRAYAWAYENLYDEDVSMMSTRQQRIDERLDGMDLSAQLEIDVPAKTDLPVTVRFSGRNFRLDQHQGDWVIYPANCPHQLGPLQGVDEAGLVTCPWHGYTFDVVSGDCVTRSNCRFGQRPNLAVADGKLSLRWQQN